MNPGSNHFNSRLTTTFTFLTLILCAIAAPLVGTAALASSPKLSIEFSTIMRPFGRYCVPTSIATLSDGNIVTVGELWPDSSFDSPDIEVTIVDPVNRQVFAQRLIGGSGWDYPYSIAVDASDNIYIAGQTFSPDFPLVSPLSSTFSLTFLLKLNKTLSSVAFSTYVPEIYATSMVITRDGHLALAGSAKPDAPLLHEFQKTGDGYLLEIDTGGTTISFASRFGGSLYDAPRIAIGPNGEIGIAGSSLSNLPLVNAIDSETEGIDGYVMTIPAGRDHITYSTFIGGEEYETITGIAFDRLGNVFVTGMTLSDSFPVKNGFQMSRDTATTFSLYYGTVGPPNLYDIFVCKISAAGELVYSTYISGDEEDVPRSIVVDADGAATITGGTGSTDFPIKGEIFGYPLAYKRPSDKFAFVTQLNSSGSALNFGTYFAGNHYDQVTAMTIGNDQTFIVTGSASSTNFPLVNQIDTARGFEPAMFFTVLQKLPPCCLGTAGNVDCSADRTIDIADLTTLVDHLFISFAPLCCEDAAEIDGEDSVDIGDLSALVDHLFISMAPLASCP